MVEKGGWGGRRGEGVIEVWGWEGFEEGGRDGDDGGLGRGRVGEGAGI